MLSKSIIAAAALALTVSAQTSTSCSPLKQDCPADPAVGKKGISCDFTKGACDAFEHLVGKAVTYGPKGAVSAVDAPLQAPTLQSKGAIFFGRLEVELQAAPGKGVITSAVLLSDDLDEIDLEAVGSDNAHMQSNTFSRGDQSKHDLLGLLPVADLTGASHKYTVDWTTERIEFSVDGTLHRTLRRSDIPDRYPESPMRVKIGAWVGGYEGGDGGTTTWAGGIADFSNSPASSYFKSVTVTDYAGGNAATDKDVKEYSYGDRSGSSKSIRIHLADGSTITGDSPSSESGISSRSSTSSTSSSAESTKSSSAEASASTTTSTRETLTMDSSTATSEVKTHSTIGTKTASGTSGNKTQSATASKSPSSTPSGAAAGLSIGTGLVAVAAFFAM